MKKRIFALLAALWLMIPQCGVAGYVAHNGLYNSKNFLEIPGEGVGFYIFPLDTFTFVTPETLDEHMDLCLSRGGTREGVRLRMNTGHVLWEGYSDIYPNGWWRLEVYEDDYTRSVWDLKDLYANQIRRVGEDMDAHAWLWERYYFFDSKKTNYNERQSITGSFNAYPPYEYESGLYSLTFFNGKAYLLLYGQSTPASSGKLLDQNAGDPSKPFGDKCSYQTVNWIENPGNDANHHDKSIFVRLGEAKMAPADLLRDQYRAIFNLNSGVYEYIGTTESNAKVTVEANGEAVQAKVNEETKAFSAKIQLVPGENTVTLTAEKKNREKNTLTDTLTVNDDMAMLVLTEYLYGSEDRSKLRIAGITHPGATITIQVDEEEPILAEVKKDGKFSQKITASDWEEHVVTVTASQEGKEDCTVRTDFTAHYADDQKGLAAYRKELNKELEAADLFEKPGEYVGEKVSLYVRCVAEEFSDGRMVAEAKFVGSGTKLIEKEKNICYLVLNSYAEDWLGLERQIHIYGEVLEPAHLEEGDVLRIQVRVVGN